MEAVLLSAQEWEFVDPDRIALMGASQGGMASAVAASRHADEFSGLILLYPALIVRDAVREEFASLDDIPEKIQLQRMDHGGKKLRRRCVGL